MSARPWWRFPMRQPRSGRLPYRPGLLAWTWLVILYLVVWPSWAVFAMAWYMIVGVVWVYLLAWRGLVWLARTGVAAYADRRPER